MFGKHAAYIIPSYGITALVIFLLIVWILGVYWGRKIEIGELVAKGFKRGEGTKNERE